MRSFGAVNRCLSYTTQSGHRARRCSQFSHLTSQATSKYQLYISRSSDPVFNLSIEHYLLQSTPATSTVLFLYANRPCIVIGRNQNPWLETNLGALRNVAKAFTSGQTLESDLGSLEVIRRRSGGGAVFHDGGNVNFSVICPPETFTRDKHAEMVVRAIRRSNPRARVNNRHDIVLDTGSLLPLSARPAETETHQTAYEQDLPLKVSGSAYKLTRTRALHHGTCLVNSKNIGNISNLLRSPLAPFVKARGVDSVKSAVGNVFATDDEAATQEFERDVIMEFCHSYNIDVRVGQLLPRMDATSGLDVFDNGVYGVLDEELMDIKKIQSGVEEMRSVSWLYGQTPQFTFSTFPTTDDPRPRPLLPSQISPSAKVRFTARSGRITSAELSLSPSVMFNSDLVVGQELHRLDSWNRLLRINSARSDAADGYGVETQAIGDWLDEMFAVQA